MSNSGHKARKTNSEKVKPIPSSLTGNNKMYNQFNIKHEVDQMSDHTFETVIEVEEHTHDVLSMDKLVNEAESVICTMCTEQFESERKLNKHILSSHNVHSETDECSVKKEFDNTLDVYKTYNHITLKHEIDQMDDHAFETVIEVVEPRPLRNEKSLNETDSVICSVCSEQLSSKRKLNSHFISFHNSRSTTEECLAIKEFQNTLAAGRNNDVLVIKTEKDCVLESEIQNIFRNQPFDAEFNSEDKNLTPTFECNYCQKSLKSKRKIKNHISSIHFPCNVTNSSINTKVKDCNSKKTIKHSSEKNKIVKKRRFDCNKSQKRFTTKSNNIQHITNPQSSSSKVKEAPQNNNINRRSSKSKVDTLNENPPFKCGVCLKSFSFQQNLKRHWRIHTGEKPYKCDVCKKYFSQQSNLKTHARIHIGEKPYKCDVCKITFCQQANLKTHARIHIGEKPFQCDVCKKTFSHQSNLKTHARTHTGEKPYKCDVCKKTFSHQSNLKTHARVHIGEKPYKCDVCEKTFSHQTTLKSHERIHTGEKPYKCDVCEKTFSQQSHLKSHERIHIGGVQYKCSVCDKSYGRQDTLKRHQAKAHD